jgi:hypothetical protein
MYCKVIQVWSRGIKRSDRDLANDPGSQGELSMTRVSGHPRLSLQAYGNTTSDNHVLPDLFEPVLLGWRGPQMVFRGYQQLPGKGDAPGQVYFQEWRVTILGEHPAR